MYSRETGFSHSKDIYSAEYLRSRYAAKTEEMSRRNPLKIEPPKVNDAPPDTTQILPTKSDEKAENTAPLAPSGINEFISHLEGDDLLMLAVLALLLFNGGEKKNTDIILAAALMFIEFA